MILDIRSRTKYLIGVAFLFLFFMYFRLPKPELNLPVKVIMVESEEISQPIIDIQKRDEASLSSKPIEHVEINNEIEGSSRDFTSTDKHHPVTETTNITESTTDVKRSVTMDNDLPLYETFYLVLSHLMQSKDVDELANMNSYPLIIYTDSEKIIVKNKEEFIEKSDFIFEEGFLVRVDSISPTHSIDNGTGGVIIGDISIEAKCLEEYINDECDTVDIKVNAYDIRTDR